MSTTGMIFKNENYQINRENRCCKCGSQKGLTRHHIIPSCFISKLKEEIKVELKKDHPFYYEWDYCCLCDECHKDYEKTFSESLMRFIYLMYNVDLSKTSFKNNHSNLPKPSEVVMGKINSKEDFLKLRELCTDFFIDTMDPKFTLI